MSVTAFAVVAVAMGVGATLLIDVWTWVLRHVFAIASLDFCLLGRWILHMPRGVFVHARISRADRRAHECSAGWVAHYSIGIGFAVAFLLIAPGQWLLRPTLMPALAFGAATVLVPFLTLQPAFGLGFAASRTPHPWRARLKSLGTHVVFGVGLYGVALLSSMVM